MTKAQAIEALALYQRIPLQLADVSLAQAVTLASQWHIYAYDAYMLVSAQQYNAPLLSLDTALLQTARAVGVDVVEL